MEKEFIGIQHMQSITAWKWNEVFLTSCIFVVSTLLNGAQRDIFQHGYRNNFEEHMIKLINSLARLFSIFFLCFFKGQTIRLLNRIQGFQYKCQVSFARPKCDVIWLCMTIRSIENDFIKTFVDFYSMVLTRKTSSALTTTFFTTSILKTLFPTEIPAVKNACLYYYTWLFHVILPTSLELTAD